MFGVPRYGDRALAIDGGTIVCASVAICIAADQLALMTVLIPALIGARTLLWLDAPRRERGPLGAELLLLGMCTAIGGFNDYNSVVIHRIYDYAVPVYFPEHTTIPIWMLIYWGMILRFLITLFRWRRLNPPAAVAITPARIAGLLILVVVTRQAIYRWYLDPVLSWLPFAIALVGYVVLARPGRREAIVAGLFAVGGPLVEVAYIQLGGLHRYALGWLAGVPLWIALWWVLAALVWLELSPLLQRLAQGRGHKVAASSSPVSR